MNEKTTIEELQNCQAKIFIEIVKIQQTIGEEPSKIDQKEGTGLKGLVCEMSDKIDRIEQMLISRPKTRNWKTLTTNIAKYTAIIAAVLSSAYYGIVNSKVVIAQQLPNDNITSTIK